MRKCDSILVCISVCLINIIGCSLLSTDARKLNKKIELVRSCLEYRLISALVDIDDLRNTMGTCKCTDGNTTVIGQPDRSMSNEIERKIDSFLQKSELRVMNMLQGFQDEKASRKNFEKKMMDLVHLPDAQNGGWSSWSTWTDCSVEILAKFGELGDQTRSRSCSNPAPSGFGRSCSGNDWQTRTCPGLRLVHGTTSHNGRVEVFFKGQWGTVCDDEFTDKSAKVVCRMLGLPTTSTTQYQAAHYGQGSGPIWLADVVCTGTENSILDCKNDYTGSSNGLCDHSEDVGVSCA